MNDVSVDDAIRKLEQIKKESPLGGNTCVALCLVESGLQYVGIDDIILEKDQDGATAVVMVLLCCCCMATAPPGMISWCSPTSSQGRTASAGSFRKLPCR